MRRHERSSASGRKTGRKMSYVHTVANALTLPAMPDMKPAISAVTPTPSRPGPRYRAIISGITSLKLCPPVASASLSPTSFIGNTASPSKPGRITMAGSSILNAAPMMVAIFAERRSRAASTRCTTRKSVVQYPNAPISPKPNTMPVQCTPIGLSAAAPMLRHMWV